MKTLRFGFISIVCLLASGAMATAEEAPLDLRRAVPDGVYIVVHGKHNPKRDFESQYYRTVWKTVEETKIVEKMTQIVASRLSEDDVQKARAVLDELKKATAPIKIEALADCKEMIYAQKMTMLSGDVKVPTSQHLVLLRLTPEAAADTQQGVKNLLGLVEKYSHGHASVKTASEGDASVLSLQLSPQIPFQPTVIRIGDVLLLSSSDEMAHHSLDMLRGGEGTSKFDDPRLKEALRHLPAPEDSLVFYDAKEHFSQMRGMVDFVRSTGHGNPEAERIAGLLDLVFDEASILDYQVTVEYTEGNLIRTVEYGKILPGAEKKTIAKVFEGGAPFANWQAWVPANAVSFSLTTGANLHPLYERAIAVVEERFPEAKPELVKFEQLQSQFGVHLDRDLLQAFSGECVSVSLPPATPSSFGGNDWVLAMRCHKPDRIRELLHRLLDAAKDHPLLAAQQFRLTASTDLEQFDEFSALTLTGFGIKPVVGFRDGWMILGANADAVKTVLATKAGESPNFGGTDAFRQFHLVVEGPVTLIHYTNLGERVRRIANFLNQAGTLMPMIIGLVGAHAQPDDLKLFQEVFGLLPSVAKIVSKFDYLESQIGVSQAGSQPDTYQRSTVTVVRPIAGR